MNSLTRLVKIPTLSQNIILNSNVKCFKLKDFCKDGTFNIDYNNEYQMLVAFLTSCQIVYRHLDRSNLKTVIMPLVQDAIQSLVSTPLEWIHPPTISILNNIKNPRGLAVLIANICGDTISDQATKQELYQYIALRGTLWKLWNIYILEPIPPEHRSVGVFGVMLKEEYEDDMEGFCNKCCDYFKYIYPQASFTWMFLHFFTHIPSIRIPGQFFIILKNLTEIMPACHVCILHARKNSSNFENIFQKNGQQYQDYTAAAKTSIEMHNLVNQQINKHVLDVDEMKVRFNSYVSFWKKYYNPIVLNGN